jgi:hypothetical protein
MLRTDQCQAVCVPLLWRCPKDGVLFPTEQNLTLSKSRRDLVAVLRSPPVEGVSEGWCGFLD